MIIENRALWLARSFTSSCYSHQAVIITLKAGSFQNDSQICWCFGVGNWSIIFFSRIIINVMILKQLVAFNPFVRNWIRTIGRGLQKNGQRTFAQVLGSLWWLDQEREQHGRHFVSVRAIVVKFLIFYWPQRHVNSNNGDGRRRSFSFRYICGDFERVNANKYYTRFETPLIIIVK